MLFIKHPLTVVALAVSKSVRAFPMSLSLLIFPLINITILKFRNSSAMRLTLGKFACVLATITFKVIGFEIQGEKIELKVFDGKDKMRFGLLQFGNFMFFTKDEAEQRLKEIKKQWL